MEFPTKFPLKKREKTGGWLGNLGERGCRGRRMREKAMGVETSERESQTRDVISKREIARKNNVLRQHYVIALLRLLIQLQNFDILKM